MFSRSQNLIPILLSVFIATATPTNFSKRVSFLPRVGNLTSVSWRELTFHAFGAVLLPPRHPVNRRIGSRFRNSHSSIPNLMSTQTLQKIIHTTTQHYMTRVGTCVTFQGLLNRNPRHDNTVLILRDVVRCAPENN